MSLSVRPLSPALGAEITGVDLSADIDDATRSDILAAFLEYHLLVFPGQTLGDADHVRFCEIFGEIQPERLSAHVADKTYAGVHYVSNARPDAILPEGEIEFHMDQMQYDRPARAMSLYGIEVPKTGGETRFANCHLAYDALTDEMKRRVDGLKAECAYMHDSPNRLRKVTAREPEAPHAVHPVVRTHPVTGRKAIHVSPLETDRILGMGAEESDRLLDTLFGAVDQERFIYEHSWRVGDLIVWDNRCIAHARNDFDAVNERRMLRRIAVMGEIPY
jgi:taurine dioxygenase